jgi:hypothetical protein
MYLSQELGGPLHDQATASSDPDATFNTANDATGGGTFNYDFDTVNDVDVFSFTLQPGETVQLETTSGPDTQLGLFNRRKANRF